MRELIDGEAGLRQDGRNTAPFDPGNVERVERAAEQAAQLARPPAP